MNYAGGISSYNYTDACASPLYIGEISVFLIYRRNYRADEHRRDFSLPYMQTHLPRRWTSARYQSFLYADARTLPLYIGEISVFLIHRRMCLAVVHRRDISLPYTSADVRTLPLYIGEISVFLIYRRMHLAVVHR